MESLVSIPGQRPIAMASDGHSLLFIGTETDVLSSKLGKGLTYHISLKKDTGKAFWA